MTSLGWDKNDSNSFSWYIVRFFIVNKFVLICLDSVSADADAVGVAVVVAVIVVVVVVAVMIVVVVVVDHFVSPFSLRCSRHYLQLRSCFVLLPWGQWRLFAVDGMCSILLLYQGACLDTSINLQKDLAYFEL